MIWVVDASVAVRWFLEEEASPAADRILRAIIDDPCAFAVPELFAYEVLSALCRLHPAGPGAFIDGVLPLLTSGLLRQPMTEGLARKAEVFVRAGLTGYDASYAALAQDLGGVWLTFDRKAHRRIAAARVSHCLADGLPDRFADS